MSTNREGVRTLVRGVPGSPSVSCSSSSRSHEEEDCVDSEDVAGEKSGSICANLEVIGAHEPLGNRRVRHSQGAQ